MEFTEDGLAMNKVVFFVCNKRERSFGYNVLSIAREIREFQDDLVKDSISLSYDKTMYLSVSHSTDSAMQTFFMRDVCDWTVCCRDGSGLFCFCPNVKLC